MAPRPGCGHGHLLAWPDDVHDVEDFGVVPEEHHRWRTPSGCPCSLVRQEAADLEVVCVMLGTYAGRAPLNLDENEELGGRQLQQKLSLSAV